MHNESAYCNHSFEFAFARGCRPSDMSLRCGAGSVFQEERLARVSSSEGKGISSVYDGTGVTHTLEFIEGASSEAVRFDWPGNLREWVNMAERLLVLGLDSLQLANLKSKARSSTFLGPGFSLVNHLEHIEQTLRERAFEKMDGDRRKVGRLLGVERNSLRYKLKKHGLL